MVSIIRKERTIHLLDDAAQVVRQQLLPLTHLPMNGSTMLMLLMVMMVMMMMVMTMLMLLMLMMVILMMMYRGYKDIKKLIQVLIS